MISLKQSILYTEGNGANAFNLCSRKRNCYILYHIHKLFLLFVNPDKQKPENFSKIKVLQNRFTQQAKILIQLNGHSLLMSYIRIIRNDKADPAAKSTLKMVPDRCKIPKTEINMLF